MDPSLLEGEALFPDLKPYQFYKESHNLRKVDHEAQRLKIRQKVIQTRECDDGAFDFSIYSNAGMDQNTITAMQKVLDLGLIHPSQVSHFMEKELETQRKNKKAIKTSFQVDPESIP